MAKVKMVYAIKSEGQIIGIFTNKSLVFKKVESELKSLTEKWNGNDGIYIEDFEERKDMPMKLKKRTFNYATLNWMFSHNLYVDVIMKVHGDYVGHCEIRYNIDSIPLNC